MLNLNILRDYAQKVDVSELPSSVLFTYTASSLTIFDAYPKSIFHFLLLPRVLSSAGRDGDATVEVDGARTSQSLKAPQLRDLQSLLKVEKAQAKDILLSMHQDALEVKKQIEEEMVNRYGFKWDIYSGFHAAPSMEHLHLHIVSSDFCSPSLKHKKHYNSFHPKHGFFLHLEDVLSWFDDDTHFERMAELNRKQYDIFLKHDLECFHCSMSMKNMPTLKSHLQDEFNKAQTKAKDKAKIEEALQKISKRKRRSTDVAGTMPAEGNHRETKRRETDVVNDAYSD